MPWLDLESDIANEFSELSGDSWNEAESFATECIHAIKQRYAKCKENGTCFQCGAPSVKPARCKKHDAIMLKSHRDMYWSRVKSGACGNCGETREPSRAHGALCQMCLDIMNAKSRARRSVEKAIAKKNCANPSCGREYVDMDLGGSERLFCSNSCRLKVKRNRLIAKKRAQKASDGAIVGGSRVLVVRVLDRAGQLMLGKTGRVLDVTGDIVHVSMYGKKIHRFFLEELSKIS